MPKEEILRHSLCVLGGFEILTKRGCQLIGAGGGLEAATNTAKALDRFLYTHTNRQSRDALGITRASALKLDLTDHSVLYFNFDLAGADSLGKISDMFHYIFLSMCDFSVLMTLNDRIKSDGGVAAMLLGQIEIKSSRPLFGKTEGKINSLRILIVLNGKGVDL